MSLLGSWLDRRLRRGGSSTPPTKRKDILRQVQAAQRAQQRGQATGRVHAPTGVAGGRVAEARPQPAAVDISLEGPPPEILQRQGEIIADLYRLDQFLGAGGMGQVWRVRHLSWGTDLAMKEILPERLAEPKMRTAFLNEADKWVKLPMHPNIVTAYYVRELDGQTRIFCEYIEGSRTLAHMIPEGGWSQSRRYTWLCRWLMPWNMLMPISWCIGM